MGGGGGSKTRQSPDFRSPEVGISARVKLHEGNPGEIDFSSSKREVRVGEGLSSWESTVHVCCIDCIHVDLCVAGTGSPPSNASAA